MRTCRGAVVNAVVCGARRGARRTTAAAAAAAAVADEVDALPHLQHALRERVRDEGGHHSLLEREAAVPQVRLTFRRLVFHHEELVVRVVEFALGAPTAHHRVQRRAHVDHHAPDLPWKCKAIRGGMRIKPVAASPWLCNRMCSAGGLQSS